MPLNNAFTTCQQLAQLIGRVKIFAPTGMFILTIGILFTVGWALAMILKGKKD